MPEPHVLLVEDNPDDVALAERAILKARLRAKLQVAHSGDEAWELLKTQFAGRPPKVVFLDLNMPESSGFELLARLRGDKATRCLPVVILTTSKEPVDIERSYALGANSYVTKPVDFEEFSDVFAKMTGYWISVNEVL